MHYFLSNIIGTININALKFKNIKYILELWECDKTKKCLKGRFPIVNDLLYANSHIAYRRKQKDTFCQNNPDDYFKTSAMLNSPCVPLIFRNSFCVLPTILYNISPCT